eukprot:COSAG02_NODE_3560_length_6556_cov_20.015778_3_plen_156_part_00
MPEISSSQLSGGESYEKPSPIQSESTYAQWLALRSAMQHHAKKSVSLSISRSLGQPVIQPVNQLISTDQLIDCDTAEKTYYCTASVRMLPMKSLPVCMSIRGSYTFELRSSVLRTRTIVNRSNKIPSCIVTMGRHSNGGTTIKHYDGILSEWDLT